MLRIYLKVIEIPVKTESFVSYMKHVCSKPFYPRFQNILLALLAINAPNFIPISQKNFGSRLTLKKRNSICRAAEEPILQVHLRMP